MHEHKWTKLKISIQTILDLINIENIEIYHVKYIGWDIPQQSRLIESILMDYPLPSFYFGCNVSKDSDQKWKTIDGNKRLGIVSQFMNNKFELTDLPILKEYENKSFSSLSYEQKKKILDYKFDVNVIEYFCDNVANELYTRMNY